MEELSTILAAKKEAEVRRQKKHGDKCSFPEKCGRCPDKPENGMDT